MHTSENGKGREGGEEGVGAERGGKTHTHTHTLHGEGRTPEQWWHPGPEPDKDRCEDAAYRHTHTHMNTYTSERMRTMRAFALAFGDATISNEERK